jgi:hypothetical protein
MPICSQALDAVGMTAVADRLRGTVALAIFCKTPIAGESKTRLAPLLGPEECAQLSACFIADLSNTIHALTSDGDVVGYALYTPKGTEPALMQLLPPDFELCRSMREISGRAWTGHSGPYRIRSRGSDTLNSDSPTLPRQDPARGRRCGPRRR